MACKHIVIGGGSGFIGSALASALRARGDLVTVISRQDGIDRLTWAALASKGLPKCDAVVNLAGQHILQPGRLWTRAYRNEVVASRLRTTKTLVDAINASAEPPEVFISTAGKCFYGTERRPDSYPALDETAEPMGVDFPAELVGQWEQAADHLDTKRVRHVRVRIGVVLGAVERMSPIGRLWRIGRARGFLPIIRLPFCFGLGCRLGHGRQPFPWIHIDDMIGILLMLIDDQTARGRFNAVSPGIVTNTEFTEAFARALRRPILWSMPEWLIVAAVGRDRASILTEGQNVVPARTLAQGYRFRYAKIDPALEDLVEITF
ncbi:MAG: TIGR01777 family oxidoreductase [Pseudomonadota bacterium]